MTGQTTPPLRRRDVIVAATLRAVRRRHGRRGLCRGAALQLVLPRHRLQRHDAGRDLGAGRRARPHDHGAVRRQCRPRPALALRARAELDRGQARRGRDRQLPRHQPGGAPDHGVGRLQRHAAQRRRLFPEDQLLLLHRAEPEGGRDAGHGGGLLRRSRRWRRTPTAPTSTPSRCPTRSIRNASRTRPVADSTPAGRPGQRFKTQRRPKWPTRTPSRTTTTTSSIRAPGRRSARSRPS